MRRVTVVLAVLVAGLGAEVPVALGSRAPSATERAALAQATRVPRRCLRMRISTVQSGWASVTLGRATGNCAKYAADGILIYRRIDDVWHRRFAGSSWKCPIKGVPEPVRKDLGLPCPEGGG